MYSSISSRFWPWWTSGSLENVWKLHD